MNLDARVGQLNQLHLDARRGQGRPGNKWYGEFKRGQGPESQGSGRIRRVQGAGEVVGEFRGQGK
jgi:hypothetical protein